MRLHHLVLCLFIVPACTSTLADTAIANEACGGDDTGGTPVAGQMPPATDAPVDWICEYDCWPALAKTSPAVFEPALAGPVKPKLFVTGVQSGDTTYTNDAWTLRHYYTMARSSPNAGADWSLRSYYNGTDANALAAP